MVNAEASKALPDQSMVVCTDEFGDYTTERGRLDSGMADPNRYASDRLEFLFRGKD